MGIDKKVEIKWEDSTRLLSKSWWERNEAISRVGELPLISTIGFIVYKNKKFILLADTIDGEMISGVHYIPGGCVRKIKYL